MSIPSLCARIAAGVALVGLCSSSIPPVVRSTSGVLAAVDLLQHRNAPSGLVPQYDVSRVWGGAFVSPYVKSPKTWPVDGLIYAGARCTPDRDSSFETTLLREQAFPGAWSPSRISGSRESGWVFVDRRNQLIHLNGELEVLATIPVEGHGELIAGALISSTEYEVVTPEGLLQVSSAGDVRPKPGTWEDWTAVDADHTPVLGWAVLLSDPRSSAQRVIVEQVAGERYEFAPSTLSQGEPVRYHQVTSHDQSISITSLNVTAPGLVIFPEPPDRPSPATFATEPLPARDSWVGLSLFPLDLGFLRVLSDLTSDQRNILVYDSCGQLIQEYALDAPAAAIATDATHRRLFTFQRFPVPVIREYEWRWTRSAGQP